MVGLFVLALLKTVFFFSSFQLEENSRSASWGSFCLCQVQCSSDHCPCCLWDSLVSKTWKKNLLFFVNLNVVLFLPFCFDLSNYRAFIFDLNKSVRENVWIVDKPLWLLLFYVYFFFHAESETRIPMEIGKRKRGTFWYYKRTQNKMINRMKGKRASM
jgi:hypothetical protein